MAEAVSIKFDDRSVQAGLDAMLAASQAAVRPAAQAGAEDLYLETRLRCPVSAEAHFFYGRDSKKTGVRYLFQPGNLRDAIYQVFSSDNSRAKGTGYDRATYHVAWNHLKAPYGFMVEFGTSRAAPTPFVRPAYDARKDQALAIAKAVWVQQVEKAVR